MLRIAVCDDKESVTTAIEKLIFQACDRENIVCEVDVFFNGMNMIEYMEHENVYYDIIYLDIVMKGISGLETAKRLRKKDMEILIIYVTAYTRYMLDAFEAEPFRFITKPINREKFYEIFASANQRVLKKHAYFNYSIKREHRKIPMKDIYYFESGKRLISTVTTKGIIQFYGKIDDIEKEMIESGMQFLRIHQSFLVNFHYIYKFTFDKVFLVNGQELLISKVREKAIRRQYLDYFSS